MASAYTHDDDTKSLVQFKDINVQHDHTYYGMGCSNSWGEEGLGGSDVPCATRIVPTVDDGNQKNGVYYTFQASISGSGASVTSSNKNSPDTFCPLGWQLPYSGTGGDYYDKSRSWGYLFTAYSISFNTGATADATKIKSYPFSYVYPGYYDWATGRLYSLVTSTGLWSSTVNNSTGAYFMATWSTEVHSNLTTNRARGYTLRCAVCFSIPFIDGTVEGTDISFPDSNTSHNHTYYGNGCPGSADDENKQACASRITRTADGENQTIGTVYNFSAASTGSSDDSAQDNTIAPDTFCPLGWQLPYSGTGGDYYDKSKSWRYLINEYNIPSDTTGQAIIRSYPFSYIFGGTYYWNSGYLFGLQSNGQYWSNTQKAGSAYRFYYSSSGFLYELVGKVNGRSLRCVTR